MVKVMYVLWRPPALALERFRARLLDALVPRLLDLEPVALTVNVADADGAGASREVARSDGAVPAGLVSAWVAGEEAGRTMAGVLAREGAEAAGYLVREAIPRAYDRRTWPDGTPSPGAKQVTLLRRRPDLAYEEFLRRWHEVHTPLALRVHPLWAYVRNVVSAPLTAQAPPYDGIVELVVRELADLTEPMRFFGAAENVALVLDDVQQWLDLATLEYYVMRETIVRSRPASPAAEGP